MGRAVPRLYTIFENRAASHAMLSFSIWQYLTFMFASYLQFGPFGPILFFSSSPNAIVIS